MVVPARGFEPRTLGLKGRCSARLSYTGAGQIEFKFRLFVDLPGCQRRPLTTNPDESAALSLPPPHLRIALASFGTISRTTHLEIYGKAGDPQRGSPKDSGENWRFLEQLNARYGQGG